MLYILKIEKYTSDLIIDYEIWRWILVFGIKWFLNTYKLILREYFMYISWMWETQIWRPLLAKVSMETPLRP